MTNHQKRWRAPKEVQHRARELSKEMTPAEMRLWQALRGNQLDGLYFRRQHAIGSYIVDFICTQAKLIIEVDGSSHIEQEENDQERTRWLENEKGYRVIRFTNDDILKNIHKVVEAIREIVKDCYLNSPDRGGTSSPPVNGGS